VPELPEVETVVRGLQALAGRRILAAEGYTPLVVKTPLDGAAGSTIISVRRHGKFVVLECDAGVLVIHLGMTGKLLMDGARTPYTRAVFTLDDGVLLYDDIRMFGKIEWNLALPSRVARLGPDPLSIGAAEFCEALRQRRGRVKSVLLDQTFLRGLGNIYTDEALFRARIHPKAQAAKLSKARALELHQVIVDLLTLAIAHRGSSVSDYVDADGQRGGFQMLHQVYGKEGEPCVRCGKLIKRIVIAQRGTHYCPKCQRV
jgi:formamidopyrimidine-DNA glycosylase